MLFQIVPKGSATVTSPLEAAVRVAQLVALLHEERREKEVFLHLTL